MADVDFIPSLVPEGYAASVQKAAVLYRLRSRFPMTEQRVMQNTLTLVNAWRYRLYQLRDLGWTPQRDYSETDSRWTFLRNCCPTFAYCEPRTNPCRLRNICPFCYGRWVRDVYKRVDGAFGGPPVEGERLRGIEFDDEPEREHPYHLVERKFAFLVPYMPEEAGEHTEMTWLQSQLDLWIAPRRNFMRRVGAAGAVSNYTVEPGDGGWVFKGKQLFMVDKDHDTKKLNKFQPTMFSCKVKRNSKPTRKEICNAVARACAYPIGLMQGETELVKIILEARRGRRLTALFGRFRGSSR